MNDFTITCERGKFADRWVVRTSWYGQDRVVFEDASVFICCRWVRNQAT